MAPKPPGRLGSALLPIGAVAIVAGCSGGSVNSSGAYVPPAAGVGSANRPMTTAQVTLQFGTGSSSAGRQAMSLNSTVRQVGIRFIPLPAPAVTPTEQVFTIPQPAPASTTLTVSGPVGQDQFILGAYEPPPTCAASAVQQPVSKNRRPATVRAPLALPALVPLNGSVQTVNLSANGSNSINAPVGPVAFGGAVLATPQPTLGAGYLGTTQWSPLENLSTSQSIGMQVIPVNVCGTQLPTTTVANSVVVSGPGGVAFSSTTFSAAGTTTATYAANTNSSGTISASATLPANTAPQNAAQSVNLVPDYFIFALDSTGSYLNVLDGQTGQNLDGGGTTLGHSRVSMAAARQSQRGSRTTQSFGGSAAMAMAAVNASPCTSGAQAAAVAVVGNLSATGGNGIEIFRVTPSGTVSGPTPLAWTSGSLGISNPGTPQAVAFDAACRLYVGDSFGYLGVGSIGGITSIANENGFSGYGVSALLAGSSSMYAGYQNGGNWLVGTFPFSGTTITSTGFPPLSTSSYSNIDGLALAGGNVFVASATSSCMGDFRTLSGAMLGSGTAATMQFFGSTTGTLYAVNGGYLLTVGSTGIQAPGGGSVTGGAVTADSPTSTLWMSSGNGPIFQFSLAGGLSQTGVQYGVPFPNSGVPGPLSIAP